MLTTSDIARIVSDPRDFIPLLQIEDEQGILRHFNTPHPEQVEILKALMKYPEVYILKPRQIGCSTICRAYDFWYGYTCTDPIKSLIVSHEGDSTEKMHRANSQFLDGLARMDQRLARPLRASNRKEIAFNDTGAMFRCVTAGGKGAGKSFTYQRGHFTEVGSWDQVCNARAMWASLRATMHKGPHYQLIAESTGHGPGTLWEELVRAAERSPVAKVVFSKWSAHPKYSVPAPRELEAELDSDEIRLRTLHGLTLGQILWRRLKIEEMGLKEFRNNYPLSIEEAFMGDAGMYFDIEELNFMKQAAAKVKPIADRGGLTVYEKPNPRLKYAGSIDASSGLGQDYAAIQIFSEEYKQVAVFHCNRTTPERLAEYAAELGWAYNKALLLTEHQGTQGGVALHRLEYELDYPNTWVDDDGKPWQTRQPNKLKAYAHARRLIQGGGVELNHPATISELMSIQQKNNGALEAPKGQHDDLADACVYALWALRDIESTSKWSQSKLITFKRHLKNLPGHPY